jgi:hypothetical protein
MRWNRALDFAAYIAIGLAVVVVGILLGEFATEDEAQTVVKWVRWGGFSLIVLIGTALTRRKSFRIPSFWLLMVGFVLLHGVAWAVFLLRRVDDWHLGWSLVLAPVEYLAMDWILSVRGFPASD